MRGVSKHSKPKDQSVATNSHNSTQGTYQLVDNRSEFSVLKQLQSIAQNHHHEKSSIQLSPDEQLKSGIEQLSGISMQDVKVHYNSIKPAQLQAHAYAQGNNIHLAPGQDKYLPHEMWHVVQQKQGRVTPTVQHNDGIQINDEPKLEKEADQMGEKALQMKTDSSSTSNSFLTIKHSNAPIQMKPKIVEITWGVTHLVKKEHNSIFGGEDFREGEVELETGQLTGGQKIIIDDEKTFLSRRGANQEDPSRRLEDKQSKPSVLWYHVISVNDKDISGRKLYVRGETFKAYEKRKGVDLSEKDEDRGNSKVLSIKIIQQGRGDHQYVVVMVESGINYKIELGAGGHSMVASPDISDHYGIPISDYTPNSGLTAQDVEDAFHRLESTTSFDFEDYNCMRFAVDFADEIGTSNTTLDDLF